MSVTFTYSGVMDGHPVVGSVRGGKIYGNPFVAVRVERLIANEVNIGLGPFTGTATLDDEILARATVASVVERPRFDPAAPSTIGDAPPDAVF